MKAAPAAHWVVMPKRGCSTEDVRVRATSPTVVVGERCSQQLRPWAEGSRDRV